MVTKFFVFTPDLNQDRKIAIDERQKQEVNIETHYQANFAEKINLIWRIPSHN